MEKAEGAERFVTVNVGEEGVTPPSEYNTLRSRSELWRPGPAQAAGIEASSQG